jgi:2-dehydropantoate 2-reductase
VGRAEGATLEDDLPQRIVEGHRRAPVDAVNSMLADRLAGRRMEVDARNGAVLRAGRAHRIATPLNTMALAVLEAAGPPDLTPR